MCEISLRARNIGLDPEASSILPMSQLILADALGMTAVHLNRVVRSLKAEGAMTSQRGSLLIANLGKLVEIAGFDENYLHRRLRKAG